MRQQKRHTFRGSLSIGSDRLFLFHGPFLHDRRLGNPDSGGRGGGDRGNRRGSRGAARRRLFLSCGHCIGLSNSPLTPPKYPSLLPPVDIQHYSVALSECCVNLLSILSPLLGFGRIWSSSLAGNKSRLERKEGGVDAFVEGRRTGGRKRKG
jgi:hypothetical protein